MASTIKLKDLDKYVDNIYEAVIVIAKRAKQINDDQKRIYESQMDLTDENEDYNDDYNSEINSVENPNYIKLPKPTRLAVEELLNGTLKFEYLEKDES